MGLERLKEVATHCAILNRAGLQVGLVPDNDVWSILSTWKEDVFTASTSIGSG